MTQVGEVFAYLFCLYTARSVYCTCHFLVTILKFTDLWFYLPKMSKSTFYAIVLAASGLIPNVAGSIVPSAQAQLESRASVIAPKVMILSMLPPEAEAWYGISEFDVLAQNITVPGISPLYPDVHCTANGDVCQVTIGEAGKFLIVNTSVSSS